MSLFSRKSLSRWLQAAILAALAGLPAKSQVRTLTDQLGRTIKAEVLAVEGNKVKVKREDGQLFEMPLENLSDDDQIALKRWAKKNPPAPKPTEEIQIVAPAPNAVTMTVNRGKFSTDVTYQSTYSKDSYEEWGYNIQLVNTTLNPIENLRVEYKIFGRLYASSGQTDQSGRKDLERLGSRDSINFRTKSFRLNKYRSMGGSYNYNGALTGVWVRLYYGDTLLQEYASPESIKTKETWTTPQA